jgi:hypothetical protein
MTIFLLVQRTVQTREIVKLCDAMHVYNTKMATIHGIPGISASKFAWTKSWNLAETFDHFN